MVIIPQIDLPREELITGKRMVIYTANEKGEFPNTFDKTFIPSSISLENQWFIGYTINIIDGFNMFEIPDIIGIGLQSYNIINGSIKAYNQYNIANPNLEKLEIVMSEEDIVNQIRSKKFLIEYELMRVYNKKLKLLYGNYGVEADTWNLQLTEANAYIADNNSVVPFITNLANIRGIDLLELANLIVAKALEFSIASSTLIGQKQLFLDRAKACSTNEELNVVLSDIDEIDNI